MKYTYELIHDEDADSPRDWDNLGTMLCYHRRYQLGDKDASKETSSERAQEIFADTDNFIALPIYAYEHSGLWLSTGRGYPFSDPWDAGQLGIIYVSKAKVRADWGRQRIDDTLRKKVTACLASEVETYSQFLSGDVYVAVVKDEEDCIVDSIGGLFGYDYAEEWAKERVAELEKEAA